MQSRKLVWFFWFTAGSGKLQRAVVSHLLHRKAVRRDTFAVAVGLLSYTCSKPYLLTVKSLHELSWFFLRLFQVVNL